MSIFSDNLRLLRSTKKLSQKKLADELIITRVRLASYEDARSEPPIEILQRIARHFYISIDILISVKLNRTSLDNLSKLGDNRILLPITVDKEGKDNVEVVPIKAKAGYLAGYSDPQYIEGLPQMRLPFLGPGKYRAFPISGDSMPPYADGTFIVGRYIESIREVKNGRTYIIVSKDEGVVFKRVYKLDKNVGLSLHSDNPMYKPYDVKAQDILEIWEYAASYSTKESAKNNLEQEDVKTMLNQIRSGIAILVEKK